MKKAKKKQSNRFKDYTGQKWARLTAITLAEPPRYKGRTYWTFLCDCGTVKDLLIAKVQCGDIKSCGCYRREEIYNKQNIILGKKQQKSKDIIKKMKILREQGYPIRTIAKVLKCSPATVTKYLQYPVQ